MTRPVLPGGEGAAAITSPQPAVGLPPEFRSGLAQRGIDLETEIGRGALSVVYRATDRVHARPVAVKVLRSDAGTGYDADRFLREIQLAAGLQHPHILPVYGSGAVDGILFYVMPYVEGESLRRRLNRMGPLPLSETLRFAHEVGDALEYAHRRGVIHRDIKPENILLEAGHAVVADFGVALVVSRAVRSLPGDGGTADPRLTSLGMVVGTPAYMSPEQASGEAVLDGRSDVYALACVLYETLTGEPPFMGETARATIARRFQGPPLPIRKRRPDVPPTVAEAIERALALDPADRYFSAADFIATLAAAERRGRVSPGGRRRVGIAVTAGSLAVAAVVLLAARMPHRHPARFNPGRVAVAALSNETGDTSLASLGPMVASWITDRLSGTPGVAVVTSAIVVPAQHDQHLAQSDVDDPERLQHLAAETRAGTLVSGSYYRGERGAVEFHVEITDANSGRLLRAFGPVIGGEPEQTAAELSRAVAGAVDTLVGRRSAAPRAGS